MGSLTEVKSLVKSVVSSAERCQTSISQLDADYKSLEGQHIPFSTFGYKNLYDFLKSINDSVIVVGYGENAIVLPCWNGKNQHIINLVSRTRVRRKTKRHPPKPKTLKIYNETPPRFRKENEKTHWQTYSNNKLQAQHEPPNGRRQTASTFQYVGTTPKESTGSGGIIYNMESECKIASPKLSENESNNRLSKTNHITSFQDCYSRPNRVETNNTATMEDTKRVDNAKLVRFDNGSNKLDLSSLSGALPKPSFVPMRTFIPSIEESDVGTDEAIPLAALDAEVDWIDSPTDVVQRGGKIPSSSLPSFAKVGTRWIIFVSQVHSPYKFWFRFRLPYHALDELMNDMECFYETLSDKEFCIPVSCIVPGQICAALFNGRWHRAEILSNAIDNMVKMFYVDYGTVAETSVCDIKYLKDAFGLVESQALRGTLSHIKPRGLNWSAKANEFLFSLVNDVPIHAEITGIDEENRVCYFILCNGNGDNIINVNKMMIYEGYALQDNSWLDYAQTKERIKHFRENFPTFSMLETGEYPSLTLILKLLNNGIDYESVIDRYLLHQAYSFNSNESMPEFIQSLPFILLKSNPFFSDILTSGQIEHE